VQKTMARRLMIYPPFFPGKWMRAVDINFPSRPTHHDPLLWSGLHARRISTDSISHKTKSRVQSDAALGRGKLGPSGKISVPIKDIWVYPLAKRFRLLLKN